MLGFNWRAFMSWALGLFPLLPGFVRNVRGQSIKSFGGWDQLYFTNYFVGFAISFIAHVVLNALFPARGSKGESEFNMTKVGVLGDRSEAEEGRAAEDVATGINGRADYLNELEQRECDFEKAV